MAVRRWNPSRVQVILSVLLDEFDADECGKSEQKIRQHLRYYSLGKYDSDQVELLRRLKNEVRSEFERMNGSQYFVGNHGRLSSAADFDVPRMVADIQARFSGLARTDLEWFVTWALNTYYLR